MALLKSVDNIPGIDYLEYRDMLYWNKYEYRVRFSIPGIRHTYYCLTQLDLDYKIAGSKNYDWRKLRKQHRAEVQANYASLVNYINWKALNKADKNLSIRGEHDTVSVFSNDLSLLKTVETIDSTLEYKYTKVITTGYSGIKYFVNEPKHKFRVYLRSKYSETSTLSDEIRDTVNRLPSLSPSKALTRWFNTKNGWNRRYCSSTYFIDYDDESSLSYLGLMHGELLGKKYKLEKRPDIT